MKAHIDTENLFILESLYDLYLADAHQVSPEWQNYFQSLDSEVPSSSMTRESRLEELIDAYRSYGHCAAHFNPLSEPSKEVRLDYQRYGFTSTDLQNSYPTHGLLPTSSAPLSEIVAALERLYCGNIGFEYKGIVSPQLEAWLEHEIETQFWQNQLSEAQKLQILHYLNRSELLENFLHMKYVGQKRFSLEGGDTLIPMLASLVEAAGATGVKEVVIGMAHRGRLNVMTNILNKPYLELLREFVGHRVPQEFGGMEDVKYHRGYIGILQGGDTAICLTLCPNPSHLESVDPVVEGIVRAKQLLNGDEAERKIIIPILIHGDAAVAGQGVVYETLQLGQLPGYSTGGTIHFVLNNQIGFTTLPRDQRSTCYCTDIAKTFGAPVFHVNVEDPESCVKVALMALRIRQKFHIDVFIDLYCYRKYGHNEGDEPVYTQPEQYKLIKQKKSVRTLYREQLVSHSITTHEELNKLEEEFKKGLQNIHGSVEKIAEREEIIPEISEHIAPKTSVDGERLLFAARQLAQVPPGFHLHPKISSLMQERAKIGEDKKKIDWGIAETLAYATLLLEGKSVRLSGQDVGRGTFSHRHALWVDQESSAEYFPLAHLGPQQGRFEVINSSLSEMAVMGFEYGYSVIHSDSLTIWEAQFGDFSNGAQVIIDQFITSGGQKWGQKSNLVLFLPHGYEGQGPEHSSARIERFLGLCGHDNIQVVNPTTPAQLFHLLRRQMLQSEQKPLVVFTPKGLLRLPACTSAFEELTQGTFQAIIDDSLPVTSVKRLILCSGRIYYDLLERRQTSDVALVRLEQLYPLDIQQLKALLEKYHTQEIMWVQEEHRNMGAWAYIHPILRELMPSNSGLKCVSREVSASPATGILAKHEKERENLFNQVFK